MESEMDAEELEKIFKNYLESQRIIETLLTTRNNFWVKSITQYLHPTIITKQCEIDDEQGEFLYFKKIRDGLENILAGKKVPFSWHFNGAPEYIKKYLIKK